MNDERRGALRRRMLVSATVRYAGPTHSTTSLSMTCTLRNLSSRGARLQSDQGHWLPEAIEIEVPKQNLRTTGRVVWRQGATLGIAFDGEVDLDGRHEHAGSDADLRARLAYLEKERERLENRVKQLTDEL